MGLKSVHLLEIHGHLAPQDVTVFGNRVFAGIIKLRSYWVKMGFYPIILSKKTETQHPQHEQHVKTGT